MLALRTVVQPYAWGRVDGMASIVGSEPTGGPEAELWVGTHPSGPSVVEDDGRTLAEVIATDPERYLGERLAWKGHEELPFLLKILSIGAPLSLQAHPSADQAEAGFAREEAAGRSLDDPTRTYRDPNPKPEALVALIDTWALCGFRTTERATALIEGLGVAELMPLRDRLRGADGHRAALSWLLRLDEVERGRLFDAVEAAMPADPYARPVTADPSGEASARAWIARLRAGFPDDPTALAPLLIDVVRIPSGTAVHLPAGNLHAYLEGAGVEVMAASDNVLRGGLTPKHIDVDELLEVVSFEPGHPAPPVQRAIAGGTLFDCGEEAFALASIDAGLSPRLSVEEPSLLLATGGPVVVHQEDHTVRLDGGRAAFVAPGEPPVHVEGQGTLWWAMAGGNRSDP